jgi:hypothetical protein
VAWIEASEAREISGPGRVPRPQFKEFRSNLSMLKWQLLKVMQNVSPEPATCGHSEVP